MNLLNWLFQKDYWRMDETQLHVLAIKYNIPPMTLPPGDNDLAHAYIDRDRIIAILIERDNALRTKLTTIISITALLLSIAAFIKSFWPAHQ